MLPKLSNKFSIKDMELFKGIFCRRFLSKFLKYPNYPSFEVVTWFP